MAPAFGFSVGDFIAVAALIWRLSQALNEASEDSKLFREIQLELSAFRDVVIQLEYAMKDGAAASKDQVDRTRAVFSRMERGMNEFNKHTENYKGGGRVDEEGTRGIASIKRRVQWTFFGKKQVGQFREALRSYTIILNLIMQSLTNQALRDLRQEVQSGTLGLGQRMQTNTALITSHIDTALSEPWDQKPVRFQDAIGRRYPVPLEVCGTFEVLSLL
ncbi:hypothetical protein BJX68DRAFT_166512 [Aspergillus pseudodeflectus]|uniref:Fungal N-terminal domain-containing protein n=1 Tax=Aspergillus pseudodeflectus TaxID=176178 RepID=A0ABR4JRG2_9EURO